MQHKGRHGEALTEGDEMADELVNAGTMLDEGFFCHTQGQLLFSKRDKRCTQLCSMQPVFTV